MLIFKRMWIYIILLFLVSVKCQGQEIGNFYFHGWQEISKRKYVDVDLYLFHDTLEISYPKNNKTNQKIAYTDIYKAQIESNVGKEILKYSLIGGLAGFMIFASLPPDFLYFGGGTSLLYWKSPIIITLQTGATYKIYVSKNHILKKKITQMCANTKF